MSSIRTYGYNKEMRRSGQKTDRAINISDYHPYLDFNIIRSKEDDFPTELYLVRIKEKYDTWMRKNLFSGFKIDKRSTLTSKKIKLFDDSEKTRTIGKLERVITGIKKLRSDFDDSSNFFKTIFAKIETILDDGDFTFYKMEKNEKQVAYPIPSQLQNLFHTLLKSLEEDFESFHYSSHVNDFKDFTTFNVDYLLFFIFFSRKIDFVLQIIFELTRKYEMPMNQTLQQISAYGSFLSDLEKIQSNDKVDVSFIQEFFVKNLNGKINVLIDILKKQITSTIDDAPEFYPGTGDKPVPRTTVVKYSVKIKDEEKKSTLLSIYAALENSKNYNRIFLIVEELKLLLDRMKKNSASLFVNFSESLGGILSRAEGIKELETCQEIFDEDSDENNNIEILRRKFATRFQDKSPLRELFFKLTDDSQEDKLKQKNISKFSFMVKSRIFFFRCLTRQDEDKNFYDLMDFFGGRSKSFFGNLQGIPEFENLFDDDAFVFFDEKKNKYLYLVNIPAEADIADVVGTGDICPDPDLKNSCEKFGLEYVGNNNPFRNLPRNLNISRQLVVKNINPESPAPEFVGDLNRLDSMIVSSPEPTKLNFEVKSSISHDYCLTVRNFNEYTSGAFYKITDNTLDFVDNVAGEYGIVKIEYNPARKNEYLKRNSNLENIIFVPYFDFVGFLKTPNYLLETKVTKNYGKFNFNFSKIDGSDNSVPSKDNSPSEIFAHCHEFRERRRGNVYCIIYKHIGEKYIPCVTNGKFLYSLEKNSALDCYTREALQFVFDISKLDTRFKSMEIKRNKDGFYRSRQNGEPLRSVHSPNFFLLASVLKPDDLFYSKNSIFPYDVKILATNISLFYQVGIHELHHKRITENSKPEEHVNGNIYPERFWAKHFHISGENEPSRGLNLNSIEVHDSDDSDKTFASGSLAIYTTKDQKIVEILTSGTLNIHDVAEKILRHKKVSWAGHTVEINPSVIKYFTEHAGNQYLNEILKNEKNIPDIDPGKLSEIFRNLSNTIFSKMKAYHPSNQTKPSEITPCYDFFTALNRPLIETKFVKTEKKEIFIDHKTLVIELPRPILSKEIFENEPSTQYTSDDAEQVKRKFYLKGKTTEAGIGKNIELKEIVIGSLVVNNAKEKKIFDIYRNSRTEKYSQNIDFFDEIKTIEDLKVSMREFRFEASFSYSLDNYEDKNNLVPGKDYEKKYDFVLERSYDRKFKITEYNKKGIVKSEIRMHELELFSRVLEFFKKQRDKNFEGELKKIDQNLKVKVVSEGIFTVSYQNNKICDYSPTNREFLSVFEAAIKSERAYILKLRETVEKIKTEELFSDLKFTSVQNNVYIKIPVRKIKFSELETIKRVIELDDHEFIFYKKILSYLSRVKTLETSFNKFKDEVEKEEIKSEKIYSPSDLLNLFLFMLVKKSSPGLNMSLIAGMIGTSFEKIQEEVEKSYSRNIQGENKKIYIPTPNLSTEALLVQRGKESENFLVFEDQIDNKVFKISWPIEMEKMVRYVTEQVSDPFYKDYITIADASYLTILEKKIDPNNQLKILSTLNEMYKEKKFPLNLGTFLHENLTNYNFEKKQKELYKFFSDTATIFSSQTSMSKHQPEKDNNVFLIFRDFIDFS